MNNTQVQKKNKSQETWALNPAWILRGIVKIKWRGKEIGQFSFTANLPKIYLSRAKFETDVCDVPHTHLSDLRQIVRRHVKEFAKDTRYSIFSADDGQIQTHISSL